MKDDIQKATDILKNGGIILYPTDTIWGVGCDATNFKAVQKVINLKGRTNKSSFIILLDSEKRIRYYVSEIPEILWDLLDSIDFPVTIIYPKAKNLAKNVLAPDGSIAIRIIHEGFAHDLIEKFKKPIVSSSANFTGEPAPLLFKDISKNLIDKVDYVTLTGRDLLKKTKPSTIIKLKPNGEFNIIRE